MGVLAGVSPQLFLILAALLSSLVGVIAFLAFTRAELTRLSAGYEALMAYLGDGDTKDIIVELTSAIKAAEYENLLRKRDIDSLYGLLSSCVQKVSLVRYNAFGNATGDLSFSAALLDAEDTGFVISSLYSREQSTTYAKPIRNGASKHVLTEEERRAVESARGAALGRAYYGEPQPYQPVDNA